MMSQISDSPCANIATWSRPALVESLSRNVSRSICEDRIA